MKYDDLIESARRQDAGPTPGPDFPALMGASAAAGAGASKSALSWILGLLGGGAIVAGIMLGSGPSPEPVSEVAEASAPLASPTTASSVGAPPASTPEAEPQPESLPEASPPEQAPEVDEDSAAAETDRSAKSKGSRSPREDPEVLYRSSERHMAAGGLSQARRDLRKIIRNFPGWSRRSTAMIDLARLETRMGRSQSAACSYQAFLASYPQDMMAGEAKKALSKLQTANDLDLGACR